MVVTDTNHSRDTTVETDSTGDNHSDHTTVETGSIGGCYRHQPLRAHYTTLYIQVVVTGSRDP